MRRRRKIAAALCTFVIGLTAPDIAATAEESSPGTSAEDFDLPQRLNDDFKPGTSCSTPNMNGIYPIAKRRWFKQTDAASVANHNDHPVPVQQQIKDVRTQTLETSAQVKGKGDLVQLMNDTFGFSYVYTEHWGLTQVVGPYDLPAGKQGRLVWGFLILDTTNQNVKCGEDLVWHKVGSPFDASIPESRYSELRVDGAIEG
ncbi:hypothetical protein [Corynebacterium kroppenstedtii]|jgi:putative secreted protein|uniref:Secreted protein n=1 Tax=Corynebacterium kroppenstedtii TaxID=161879 RepID=A0A2W5T3U7_9CORY|nr:hypothetical protein [Corynebacterium kroppenstedtii]MDU7287828.1 hypothetical protein [Corynebacterium kroppenstedtii]PZR06095.1 MAG: hypothetical protein DI525_01955 [Corynebacterium kroppenstedtii]